MVGGPKSALRAVISVPGAATARAAAPILSVIEAVVLGLITRMRMVVPVTARRRDRVAALDRRGADRRNCRIVPLCQCSAHRPAVRYGAPYVNSAPPGGRSASQTI